jgi:hypothetical protein
MSLTLTEKSLRAIVTKAVDKKYGMTLSDYIRLMKDGSAPEDENLQSFIRRLPEWDET